MKPSRRAIVPMAIYGQHQMFLQPEHAIFDQRFTEATKPLSQQSEELPHQGLDHPIDPPDFIIPGIFYHPGHLFPEYFLLRPLVVKIEEF